MPDTNDFGAQISPAHSISDMIDNSIKGHSAQFQFPEDRPKYFTTIDFRAYSTPTSPGSIGAGLHSLIAQAEAGAAKLPEGMQAGAQALINQLKDRDTWLAGLGTDANTSPQVATQTTTATMILPLPVGLTDVHRVHWDEKSIVPWLSSLVGQTLADPIKSVGGLFGLAPNFFQTMLFDRPEFKRFELAFKLSPRNFRESIAIRDIIWTLNNAMSPSVETGGLIFGFPNIIQVTLRPNNGWLFKFKPAIIETLAINYAGGEGHKAFYHDSPPQGSGDHNTNAPESVEITLHIIEIEYWLHNQFTQQSD